MTIQKLVPVKASLIADLVDLININLADLLRVQLATCPDCEGKGVCGVAAEHNDDLTTCATCGGTGAIERYVINHDKLKSQKFGRLIEGFDIKSGQMIPKLRSKDKAFAMLTKLLGLDKALLEITNAATLSEVISIEQREAYIAQLKELASEGLLDG